MTASADTGRWPGRAVGVHPKEIEEIVGAIFSAAGYTVRVTSFSADGSMDVLILDGPGDTQVGIEVMT